MWGRTIWGSSTTTTCWLARTSPFLVCWMPRHPALCGYKGKDGCSVLDREYTVVKRGRVTVPPTNGESRKSLIFYSGYCGGLPGVLLLPPVMLCRPGFHILQAVGGVGNPAHLLQAISGGLAGGSGPRAGSRLLSSRTLSLLTFTVIIYSTDSPLTHSQLDGIPTPQGCL